MKNSKTKKKKCTHNWNGEVNTRKALFNKQGISQYEMPYGSYVVMEDYIICKRCGETKIVRKYNKQISV